MNKLITPYYNTDQHIQIIPIQNQNQQPAERKIYINNRSFDGGNSAKIYEKQVY